MTSEQKELDSRLNELLSFTAWLEANLPTIAQQTDEDTRMMLTELDSVLEWYEQEIMRQIEGRPADELYCEFLTLTSLKAMFIRMDLFERHPHLADYKPADEPQDVAQAIVKHLLDAEATFKQAKAEMAEYLPLPDLSGLMHRVFGAIFGLPASDYAAQSL